MCGFFFFSFVLFLIWAVCIGWVSTTGALDAPQLGSCQPIQNCQYFGDKYVLQEQMLSGIKGLVVAQRLEWSVNFILWLMMFTSTATDLWEL